MYARKYAKKHEIMSKQLHLQEGGLPQSLHQSNASSQFDNKAENASNYSDVSNSSSTPQHASQPISPSGAQPPIVAPPQSKTTAVEQSVTQNAPSQKEHEIQSAGVGRYFFQT